MRTLGLDLGGTKIAAAVCDEGRIVGQRRTPTPQTGSEAVLDAIADIARTLLSEHGPVHAAGVGSPGPIEAATGTILFAPNIPGMENVRLVDGLRERLSLPVLLENDANAAGYAEHLYGAARSLEASVFVTISTGIGGGLFLGDRVVRGANGFAGEIGHMTLLPGGPVGGDGVDGSLEAIAAGRSIARDGSYVYGRSMDTAEVFERARSGEAKALRIVENAARFTGIGLANLVKIFDPDGFVIGGGMSQVGRFYLDRIEASLTSYLEGWPVPPLLPAELGTDAGVIGAAAVAAREA